MAADYLPDMADAVLLDWEGLLANTGSSRREALVLALAAEGVALDDATYEDRCAGRSLRSVVASALGARAHDHTLVELVALRAQRELAARIAQGFVVAPDVVRFVEHAQLRAPVVIVTAAGRDETEAALRLTGLRDSFSVIVTADDVPEDAPSPTQIDAAMAHLSRRRGGTLARERVLMLARNRPAIVAAREGGVRTVAVGAPAHVALEADGAIASLTGVTLDALDALVGIATDRLA
jgi:beta-phosphoglucomutase-like phosphatase (HAD superfamily)